MKCILCVVKMDTTRLPFVKTIVEMRIDKSGEVPVGAHEEGDVEALGHRFPVLLARKFHTFRLPGASAIIVIVFEVVKLELWTSGNGVIRELGSFILPSKL